MAVKKVVTKKAITRRSKSINIKPLSQEKYNRLTKLTGALYKATCKELKYNAEVLLMLRFQGLIDDDEYNEKKTKIDDLYCEKLCKLDTETLQDIITCHVEGSIKRTPRTLDVIQKELLERTLNEDN